MSSVLEMRRLSVVEGGPLDRLQLRLGLMKLQRPLIVRRAVIFALIAWLPLLILSTLQGLVLKGVKIPFLYDPSAHIRFLLSVPLLIVAEVFIGPRIVAATSHFITSGLIPEDRYQDFDAAIVDAIRLRDSTVAEVIILAIVHASISVTNVMANDIQYAAEIASLHRIAAESRLRAVE